MLELNTYKIVIENFIIDSVERFTQLYESPRGVGIYSCPWSGWITVNFNIKKSLEEVQYNCPDFEYVEFSLLDIPQIQAEYESDSPVYTLDGEILEVDTEKGDEVINKIMYDFLLSVIHGIAQRSSPELLVQLLDSKYCHSI